MATVRTASRLRNPTESAYKSNRKPTPRVSGMIERVSNVESEKVIILKRRLVSRVPSRREKNDGEVAGDADIFIGDSIQKEKCVSVSN